MSPNYKIYPSLLDKFQRFLDAESEFEGFWNESQDGGYKRSLTEISDDLERQLLDAVNRVPHEPIEAADKGTAFNALVDFLASGLELPDGMAFKMSETALGEAYYEVQYNGFTFLFSAALVGKAAELFRDAIPQYRTEATLDTKYGPVLLYGVIDEICGDRIADIKTTKDYSFGKFEKSWQKELYPYCLVTSGEMDVVNEFDFVVFKWIDRIGCPLNASVSVEAYTFNYDRSKVLLTQICERFIEWLEGHRDQIYDKKIFSGTYPDLAKMGEKERTLYLIEHERFTWNDLADFAKAKGLCDCPRILPMKEVYDMVMDYLKSE